MLFSIFKRILKPLLGTGLGRFHLLMRLYTFLYQRLAPQGVILLEVYGHKMYVDGQDVGFTPLFLVKNAYEKQVIRVFENEIKQGAVVLDIGANIGYHTLTAAKLVGQDGKVFAFEPEPSNFDLLVKNIEINGYSNVIPVQKALSNKGGKAKLFLHEAYRGAHSLLPDNVSILSAGSEASTFLGRCCEVEVETLDELFKDYEGKIDFIKIDVQGAEMAVLGGGKNMIEKNKDLKIVTEFWPAGLRQFPGSSPEEYLNMLESYGFKLYLIDESKGSVAPFDGASFLSKYREPESINLLCQRHD